jgi:hypothetical protein
MQTVGELIEHIIDINVLHFKGSALQKEALLTKIRKIPESKLLWRKVISPIKHKKKETRTLLPKMSREEMLILNAVANQHFVTLEEIISKSRKREIVDARMQAMVIFYGYLFYSLKRIGLLFNRDHSTVLHAINTTNDLIRINNIYAKQFHKCVQSVKKVVPELFESNHKNNAEFIEIFKKRKQVRGLGSTNTQSVKEESENQKTYVKNILESNEQVN